MLGFVGLGDSDDLLMNIVLVLGQTKWEGWQVQIFNLSDDFDDVFSLFMTHVHNYPFFLGIGVKVSKKAVDVGGYFIFG